MSWKNIGRICAVLVVVLLFIFIKKRSMDLFELDGNLILIFLSLTFSIIGLFYFLYQKIKVLKILKDENLYLKNENKQLPELNKKLGHWKSSNEKITEKHNRLAVNYENLKKIFDREFFNIEAISSLAADIKLIDFDASIKFLTEKKQPAFKEAKRIGELKTETKIQKEQYHQMLYKYEALLNTFPELTKYTDDFKSIKELKDFSNIESFQENFDRTRYYLSDDEYLQLSEDERNQMALDNYCKNRKSNWQIGRDYEMYCGWRYAQNNFKVQYFGIERKLSDLGRDLIAIKGDNHFVIQCKYWSKEKVIHEKYIFQHFGTSKAYGFEQPKNINVRPVFITNIKLSDTAKRFAKELKIEVKELYEMEEFPRIKCNINKENNTKIYHLPFDQQYDRTQIYLQGEFFASTVKEAVDAGFRRAFRYRGD